MNGNMKMIDRIRRFQERNQERNPNRFSEDENIFFDLTEGAHRVRLVGDWICLHSHWIGPSGYSRVQLYPEAAFKGDSRLKKSVNCPDFDIDSEMLNDEKRCTICRLHAAANDILYECSDLSREQKEFLENVSYETRFSERVFFLCIDRDNPEIAPGKKGYKIIEFPRPLMDQWMLLAKSNPDLECNSADEGIDFVIIKSRDGKRNKYTVQYAMQGTKICQTPLTDEEKAFEHLDMKKIMGRMPDQTALYERLLPEFKELITDTSAPAAPAAAADEEEEVLDDEKVPF